MNDRTNDNNSFTFYGPVELAFVKGSEENALEGGEIKLACSIAMASIMIVSLIGNISTCAVILRERSMRTPTNFYLLNLAVTDLFLSLFIPMEIYIMWMPDYPWGEIGCRLHVLFSNLLGGVGVLTISVFTIERYLVVSRPFLRQTLSGTSRVWRIVLVIWFFCLCFIQPAVFSSDILKRKNNVYCYFTMSDLLKIFAIIELFIFTLGPMVLIATLYSLIAMQLMKSNLRSSPGHQQNRDKAIRLLAAVTGSCIFCWSPFFILNVMVVVPTFSSEEYFNTWRVVYYLSMLTSYLSTMVNPILFSLMSRRFRHAFTEVIQDLCNSKKSPCSLQHTYVVTLSEKQESGLKMFDLKRTLFC